MSKPTPLSQDDQNYLQLISVFHYALGSLVLFGSLVPLVYVFMGWVVLHSPDMVGAQQGVPVEAIGWALVVIPAFLMAVGLALGALMVVTGRFIATRRQYTFCLVIAALECLFFPLGTVLGVLTLVMLVREEVKQAFTYNGQATGNPRSAGAP